MNNLSGKDLMMWKCAKRGHEFERLLICWGKDGVEKVDVLDYFCPVCSSSKVIFLGTKDEKEEYWRKEWDGEFI